MHLGRLVLLVIAFTGLAAALPALELDYAPGQPVLIQEIDCAAPAPETRFTESPAGISRVETLLGKPCRVLPTTAGEARYFAVRVGLGKGLKPGATYRLTLDYPEDKSRAVLICNWGNETALGFATGQAVGDVILGRYVPQNPESLRYPLSGRMETWSQVFRLHDRFPDLARPRGLGPRPLLPADGFWVVIAQPAPRLDPLSAGAAVSRIRLFELRQPAALALPIHYPPAELPRRHVFSREEMADGVVTLGHRPAERDESLRGVKDPADWYDYKMSAMAFLGHDVFVKDLLEFGHNQGWDSSPGGGNAWVNQAPAPDLWSRILERAARHHLSVLPYYEYRGSIGGDPARALGSAHRARRLDGGENYTHIPWCEGTNADLLDPDTLADAKKILDVSLLAYRERAPLIGAWFRQRPTSLPVSFNDANLAAFSATAKLAPPLTRAALRADPALLTRYRAWWFEQRRAFLEALATHLRTQLGPQAFLLNTNDPSEPGRSLPAALTGRGQKNAWEWKQVLVTDDPATWTPLLAADPAARYLKPFPYAEAATRDLHLQALQSWPENWGGWEIDHSCPPDDPATYAHSSSVLLSYTYNRLYTVASPRPFDAYRNPAGLALIRHYTLNENEMNIGDTEPLGYFMCDVERAGPYSMLAEARALAYGNPTLLGSLTGNSNQRGFPAYVRAFHAAFLALPALPGGVLPAASPDPEIIVRRIPTPRHGTYYAIVNTGFSPKPATTLSLPITSDKKSARLRDLAQDAALPSPEGRVTLTFYPGQVYALHQK